MQVARQQVLIVVPCAEDVIRFVQHPTLQLEVPCKQTTVVMDRRKILSTYCILSYHFATQLSIIYVYSKAHKGMAVAHVPKIILGTCYKLGL